MKIWKLADNTENGLYEGDRVKAIFKGVSYDGTIDYADPESDDYTVKFDKWEKFNAWAQKNTSQDMYDILDWMEGSFQLKDLKLLQKGMRWETLSSDLELVKTESFFYYGMEWDVREAKRIIYQNPRPISQFPVKSVEYYIKSGAIATNNTYKDANLSIPVILISAKGEDESGQFPIDGWHRIRKALETGVETLPSYILTPEETKKIRK